MATEEPTCACRWVAWPAGGCDSGQQWHADTRVCSHCVYASRRLQQIRRCSLSVSDAVTFCVRELARAKKCLRVRQWSAVARGHPSVLELPVRVAQASADPPGVHPRLRCCHVFVCENRRAPEKIRVDPGTACAHLHSEPEEDHQELPEREHREGGNASSCANQCDARDRPDCGGD